MPCCVSNHLLSTLPIPGPSHLSSLITVLVIGMVYLAPNFVVKLGWFWPPAILAILSHSLPSHALGKPSQRWLKQKSAFWKRCVPCMILNGSANLLLLGIAKGAGLLHCWLAQLLI